MLLPLLLHARPAPPRAAVTLQLSPNARRAAGEYTGSSLVDAQDAALSAIVTGLGLHEAASPVEVAAEDPYVRGSISAFVAEPPIANSGDIGLEAARELASERQAATTTKANVAWLAATRVASEESALLQLTAWVTPVVDVPHLYCSVFVDGAAEATTMRIDFLPRADAGYETALPDGTYPEPDSREAFMKGSTRADLAERYYTKEAVAWSTDLRAGGGRVPGAEAAAQSCFPPGCAGPLAVEVTVPLVMGEEATATIAEACEEAAARWIRWMQTAEKLDQRKTMETFAVDTKLRAKVAAANAAFMSNTFGDAGAEAAAAEAGPSDLADRSGAMTKAAGDNFGAGEGDASAADAQRIADGEGATWKPNL